jgi:hypothetical protein
VETLKYTVTDDYGQLARFPGKVLIVSVFVSTCIFVLAHRLLTLS